MGKSGVITIESKDNQVYHDITVTSVIGLNK